MAKSKERLEARKLRESGISIKQIAKQLNVSPGSVSLWCRDIKLSDELIKKLEKNYRDPFYGKRFDNVRKQKQKRILKTEKLNKKGQDLIGNISKRELLLVGVALYWAEGYKKDHQVGLGSSDPVMIKMFIKWLKLCFGYTTDDLIFRITVNQDHEYRIGEITEYWSDFLGVPENQFSKPFYQKVKWKKIYDNPEDYFGVLRVRVKKSLDFLRKIHGMIDGMRISV